MTARLILTLLPLILPLYVVRFHVGPIPTTLLELCLFIFLGLWMSSRSTRPGIPNLRYAASGMTKDAWFCPITLWLLAGLVGVIVADNHLAALGLWRAYFLEPTLVFMMLRDLVRTEEDRNALLRSSGALVIFLAAWAILQFVGLLPIPSPWNIAPQGIRATGPFPFPNALALFCVPFAAFFAYLSLERQPRIKRWWLVTASIAGLIVTILAKSDGGLIALGAAVFVAFILKKETRRFAVIAAVIGSVLIFAIPVTRKIAVQQILFKEWSGKVRLVMWHETWAMLRDRPLTGAGLGNFPTAIKPYHTATWMEIFQYPHNILLNLWSETGLLGILAFGWILFIGIRTGRTAALPILTALLVHGIVDVPYFKNDLAIAFWTMIILALPLTQEQKTLAG
jgi:O-antigen ligase